tara:strand:- start:834 stop:1472 length:639 start_codon:yes stop_codon:yes gene_type:complete
MKIILKLVSKGFIMAVLLASCSKDVVEGPIGPIGPQGEQGVPGQNGEQGAVGPSGEDGVDGMDGMDGMDGEDGNANVIASDWIPEQFSDTPVPNAAFQIVDERLSLVTDSMAAILVYAKDFYGTVNQIPIVISGNKSYVYVLYAESNYMVFIASTLNNEAAFFDGLTHFRYVIIPASVFGKSNGPDAISELKTAGVDIADYDAVIDYFGLKN